MTCALMVSSLRLSACFTVHSADSGTFFQFFYSIMVKRKKLWEHIFLQLFGMACKLPVALNTGTLSVAFRLFNLRCFISHFVFHSI